MLKKFEDIIDDIDYIAGSLLKSINPGADITINSVDRSREIVALTTLNGLSRTRTFGELRTIWGALSEGKPIHVDTVLRGSGSSRNQPETIFANLPYIEWLKVNRRKHIVYVGKDSHAAGQIQKMDLIKAKNLVDEVSSRLAENRPKFLVVTDRLSESLNHMRDLGFSIEAISQGEYAVLKNEHLIWFIDTSLVPDLRPGGFAILSGKSVESNKIFSSFKGFNLFKSKLPGIVEIS